MANIATLNTVFSATYDKFSAGVKGARGALGSFQDMVFSVQGALAGLGAVVGIGAIASSVHGAMESIDEVAKASDRLGLTTEALLGLRHAAKLANIEAGALEGGFTKMGRFLSEAADGGKSQVETLDKLGLKAGVLVKMPLDQVFLQFADAINKLPSPAARTAAAMDVFGKSGAELLPLLKDGSKGIAATAAEVGKLGGSFSRIDAAQVEAANDAMTRVGMVLDSLKIQMAIQISPLIEAISNKFIEWGTSGSGASNIVLIGIESVTAGMGVMLDQIEKARLGWKFLSVGAIQAAANIQDAFDFFGGAEDRSALHFKIYEIRRDEMQKNIAKVLDDTSKTMDERKGIVKALQMRLQSQFPAESFLTPGAKLHQKADLLARDTLSSFISDSRMPSEKIKSFFDDIRSKSRAAAEEVAKTAKAMNEIVPDNSKVSKFFEGLQQAGMKGFEAIKSMMSKAATDLVNDLKTPLQKFDDKIGMLQGLKMAGLITPDQFDAAKLKELKDLQSTLPDMNRRASVQEFGTQAAFASQLGSQTPSTEKEILATAKRQEQLLRDQLKAFQAGGVVFAL